MRAIDRSRFLGFTLCLAVAISFALYTSHVWEDFYITYRASKNLASGHGLVFTPGERVHSFTSPINVLIPAFLSYLFGSAADNLVLWIYRLICIGFLSASVVLMLSLAKRFWPSPLATILAVGLLILDTKTIDFTINGQEVAFTLFFLMLTFRALLLPSAAPTLLLGAAWAGLMWTRPDAVIYVACTGLGFLAFGAKATIWGERSALLGRFVRAGLICSVLYLPWLIWAWWYYGSFVPHPVIAKGLGLATNQSTMPNIAGIRNLLGLLYAPIYPNFGGWPPALAVLSSSLGLPLLVLWIIPKVPDLTKALSFGFFLVSIYFFTVIPHVFPWYVPAWALLATCTFASSVHALLTKLDSFPHLTLASAGRIIVAVGVVVILAHSAATLIASAYQLRTQQTVIEDAHRRAIGEYLRSQAQPSDTVFLECLGYIGFFSQLKMYDWPGLSSPEVVDVRRRGETSFAGVIEQLQPTWLVLRPIEAHSVDHVNAKILQEDYALAKVFDTSAELARYEWLSGRGYLEVDAVFFVFRRTASGTSSMPRQLE